MKQKIISLTLICMAAIWISVGAYAAEAPNEAEMHRGSLIAASEIWNSDSSRASSEENDANSASSSASSSEENNTNSASSSASGSGENDANSVSSSASTSEENNTNSASSSASGSGENDANSDSSPASGSGENDANSDSSSASGSGENDANSVSGPASGSGENDANSDSSSASGSGENSISSEGTENEELKALGTSNNVSAGRWEVVNFGDYSAQVYLDAHGNRVTGPQTIDGENYFFYENGALAWSGEPTWGNNTYYVQEGKLYSGWMAKDFGDYKADVYYDPNNIGALARKKVVSISDNFYAFYENGAQVWDNLLYWENIYLVKSGLVATGWHPVNYGSYSANAYFDATNNGAASTGVATINGQKYYFFNNGAQAWSGTFEDTGKQYYVSDGKIKTGWVTRDFGSYKANSYADPQTGIITVGLKEIEGEKYYFFENGAQAWNGFFDFKNSTYAVQDGLVKTGWLLRDFGAYQAESYFEPNTAAMVTGMKDIDGKKYYFFDNGARAWAGIFDLNGQKYAVQNGFLHTGWLVQDYGAYKANSYFDIATGAMKKGFAKIDGKHYYFYDNGAQAWGNNGATVIDGEIYYIVNGTAQVGWIARDFTDYIAKSYFDPQKGTMAVGFQNIDGKHYLFFDNGAQAWGNYGPTQIGDDIYYIVKGEAQVGWIAQNFGGYAADTYYDPITGIRYTGFQKIDDKYYLFYNNGAQAWGNNGVTPVGDVTYYIVNGVAQVGWIARDFGGYWADSYFFPSNGIMAIACNKIGENYYFFYDNGSRAWGEGIVSKKDKSYYVRDGFVLTNTTIYVGGKTYQAAENGELLNLIRGIDVSSHQGVIDWNAVKNSGIQFAVIRVMSWQGDAATGGYAIDAYFETNIRAARAAGIYVGAYWFSVAFNGEEALEEVNVIKNSAAWNNIAKDGIILDLPLFIDYENNTAWFNSHTTYESRTEAVRMGMIYTETVLGARPGFYSSESYIRNWFNGQQLINEGYDCWVANWNGSHGLGTGADMWQYTSKGSVAGINGNVDINICYNSSYFDTLRVYDQGIGKNVQGNAETILSRVVQNEVGGMNNSEVFKAQTVAANTYIRYILAQGKIPSVKLSLSVPSSLVRAAVNQVKNEKLYFNDALALTVYGSSSANMTNSAGNYGWVNLPYLSSTDNHWDTAYKNKTCIVKLEDLKKGIEKLGGSTVGYTPDRWISGWTMDSNGWLTSITLCGKTYTPEQFYENSWGLLSVNFKDAKYDAGNGGWVFTGVNGSGHGIGMSQYGALGMAQEGYNYKQILQNYYKGTNLI